MRTLILALFLTLPLAAQFRVASLSQQDLEELQLWEQYVAVTKQIRDLCIAGTTSGGPFDVASEVAQTFREQMRNDYPTLGKLIRAGDHTRVVKAVITCDKARIMWDGWDWNEPDANPLGTTHTVCAVGCDFTTLQAAIDAHTFGDTIELDPDETFGTAATTTLALIPDDHDFNGGCPYYTVIQSTGYSSNFTPGIAATSADVANMAKLVGGDRDSGYFNEVLEFASVIATVSGGDTTANTLTTTNPHGFIVGDKLIWVQKEQSPNEWWVEQTGSFPQARPYWVVAVPTTATLQLSTTPGGAAIDMTVLPTTFGSFGLRKFNRPVSCWKLRGVEVEVPLGEGANQEMIRLSSIEPILAATPSHNIIQHVYVHGQPSASGVVGPQIGIRMDGRNIAIRDSTVTNILGSHAPTSSEGKAILIGRAYGPTWLENLRLSGAMNGVGVGFVDPLVEYHYPGSNGGVVNKNLYVWKEPNWFVQFRNAGDIPFTTPSPALGSWCLPGMMWRDETGAPDCYKCGAGGTWGSTPEATCNEYNNLTTKNMWEIKHCTECLLWNFWGELSPYGDLNQEYWLTVKASGGGASAPNWHNARFIGYNFRTRWTNAGALLRGLVADGTLKGVVLGPIALWQGLSTEVDGFKFSYESGPNNQGNYQDGDYSNSVGTLDTWEQIRHVTQTGYSDSQSQQLLTSKAYPTGERTQRGVSIKDNITQGTGVFASGTTVNCPSLAAAVISGGTVEWENNLTFGFSAPDFSTCSTNYWNETAGANVGFSDYATGNMELTATGTGGDYRAGGARDASDGKALGVDFEILDDGMGGRTGAGVKAGIGGWSQQFDVSITAAGSTTATVEWDRPNAANSCSLYLYTNYARTTEHADTNTAGERLDSRSGNTVVAGHVTFNLGVAALTTKTQYWFEIDCATDAVKMVGSLMTN